MPKLKTAELTGVALDWAVGACEWPGGLPPDRFFGTRRVGHGSVLRGFHPSTEWEQAGPIIERERIDTYKLRVTPGTAEIWEAAPAFGMNDEMVCEGPTLLVAAMRCYVASKLGAEVDVPAEIS